MTHIRKSKLCALVIGSAVLYHPGALIAELLPAAPERLLSCPSDLDGIDDLAALPDGNYLFSYGRGVGDWHHDLFAQRMTGDGDLLGMPIAINSFVRGFHASPRIAVTETGASLIAFGSRDDADGDPGTGRDGSGYGAFARVFDPAGIPLGIEFQLNSQSEGEQFPRGIAYLGNNAFIVSWDAGTFPAESRARRFDLFGNPLGAEFSVPADPGSDVYSGQPASNGTGTYAMTWYEKTSTEGRLHLGFFGADDTLLLDRVLDSHPLPSPHRSFGPEHLAVRGNVAIVHWKKGNYKDAYIVAMTDGGEMLSDPLETSERLFGVSAAGAMLVETAATPHEDSVLVQHALTGEEIGQARRLTDSLRPTFYSWGLATSVNAWGSVTLLYPTIMNQDYHYPPPGPGAWSTFLRRFCDSSDPACDRCPGFDDATDNDADGIPDGCDPCTNTDGGPTSVSGRTFLSNATTADAYPRRTNRFSVRTEIPLPSVSATFQDLPVIAAGMRVRVEAPSGSAMLDARLPAGTFAGKGTAGWTAKLGRLRFRDRTATPRRAIRDLSIRDRSTVHPGYVRVDVTASGDRYGIAAQYLPMRTILAFGAQEDAMSGNCTEIQYDTSECTGEVGPNNNGSMECTRLLER